MSLSSLWFSEILILGPGGLVINILWFSLKYLLFRTYYVFLAVEDKILVGYLRQGKVELPLAEAAMTLSKIYTKSASTIFDYKNNYG